MPETFTNAIGMTFVRIPAGSFLMGSLDSDSHASDDEKPQHQVTINKPFDLGIHQVTQAQWEAVMGSNPSHFIGIPERPVEQVSWHDVQTFLERLNARGDGHTYFLPSEAQWEYACRAGSITAYCFGDDQAALGDYAWYDENAGSTTRPVGQKAPNAWGLYDMHGNVWEWCQNRYGPYRSDTVTAPSGPTMSEDRVLRGGCWFSCGKKLRSASRNGDVPGDGFDNGGFRLARG